MTNFVQGKPSGSNKVAKVGTMRIEEEGEMKNITKEERKKRTKKKKQIKKQRKKK